MQPNPTFLNLPEEKKRRIEGAAADEFSDNGYRSASINAIVSKVGIAKGSIFQYFGDKKGLFLFIFGQSVEKVKAYLKEVRDATADAPLSIRLEETLKAGVDFTRKHPVIYRLYVRTLAEKEIPFRSEILTSIRRYSLEYLGSLLETARDKGELRDGVNLEAACFIIDASMDRFLQALTLPHMDGGLGIHNADEDELNRRIKALCNSLLSGVTP
ncbi:TetR family transcriptional regulator [Desulfoluna limicola]|uniref:TetR family transcriptional regulator n=1 Tax=Desulfoluna limicola TaxID=2810562 RepID=A0ABM7PFI2_9BACT|nr:TetR/AcrR family transcriptional regulator [Desulfoluna limicola]BCS95924.1 TetR family transcriptional regulator [Desulfoluna limicola]